MTRCRTSLGPRSVVTVHLVLALSGSAALFGQFCGENEPGRPVPECRDSTNGEEVDCFTPDAVRLWPDGFRPGLPGQALPLDRDSSQWRSFTIPGANSGHELFQSLALAGDHLYVAYNAGLQVWDIAGSSAEDPQRLFDRDGWRGDFLAFPAPGENDFFTDDVAAIDPAGGDPNVLVALSGKDGVGLTLWRHTLAPGDLELLYQDLGTDSRQVRAAELGGTAYIFAASPAGVFVYDASQAQSLNRCLDSAGSGCGGVYRGKLGAMVTGRYLDIVERGGKIYVAASDGDPLPSRPLGLEIWEIADPSDPASAALRYSGLATDTRGPALFEFRGSFFLAAIERIGSDRVLEIFDVNGCLDADGCGSLGAPLWSTTLPSWPGSAQFLTYSTSDGLPFLYYGLTAANMLGPAVEQLFDLATLGTTNEIVEITATGASYTDACTGETVDYWGDYYPRNGHGVRNVSPQIGRFRGEYFYRAAFGILDVHVRDENSVSVPFISTSVEGAAPYYMDEAIGFSATAQKCDGPEDWTWQDDDTVASTTVADGRSATITFGLCAGGDCPSREVEVWALKAACSSAPDLIENRARVILLEPRAQIRSIDACPQSDPGCAQVEPAEFPECTALRFTAVVDGQPPFTYQWEVKDDQGEVVESGTAASLDWDTGGPPSTEGIFADGFESGDVGAWSSAEDAAAALPAMVKKGRGATKAGSGRYDVELTVTNRGGGHQTMATRQVTLTPLGALGFGDPALQTTDRGGGLFAFQADGQGATEYRWEFEDPENGGSAGCQVYAACQVYDWGTEDDQVTFQWTTPNVPGSYGVTVSIRNCVEAFPKSHSELVAVDEVADPVPPAVTGFRVDDPGCTLSLGFYQCPVGQPVDFEVTADGTPWAYEFDWDGDGVYDEQIAFGDALSHIYQTINTFLPQVRTLAGSRASDPFEIDHPIITE